MENILVTGGAGFIGSHVCEALLDKGKSIVCIDNFNDYYNPEIKENNVKPFLDNPNFKLCRIDITNKEELKKQFQENQIDKIIHLAARAGVRPSFQLEELYKKVNIEGTKNLLELAVEFKIKNFIFGSSSSVYGINTQVPFEENDQINNTISPYAKTKKAAEELCREFHDMYGLNITCLRFFTVYGPRGRPDMAPYKFTKLISQGKPIDMYGDGTTKRDYTYIADIVEGVLAALERDIPFEIINLGNSNTVELKYFISLIEKAIVKKAKINQLPLQKGDVPLTYADISKAKRLLNYNPKVKIEQGIKFFVEWFKNEQ